MRGGPVSRPSDRSRARTSAALLTALGVAGVLGAGCHSKPDLAEAATADNGHRERTGRSVIEDRYVYAPPNEGQIEVPLTLDMGFPGEFDVEEPSMIAGGATARIRYSKPRNEVVIELDAHGLPYRPTFTKAAASGAADAQPVRVEEARWQLWLAGTMFGRQHEDLYYADVPPRRFLGTRYDFAPLGPRPSPLAGAYEIFQGNARQMIGLPLMDGDPKGDLHVAFKLAYDRMVDRMGSPGAIHLVVPPKGCAPDALSNYWTESELPSDKTMTWDSFLDSIWSGEGIEILVTAEPASAERRFRPSGFVGWANVYPAAVPHGMGLDYCAMGSLVPVHGGSYQAAPWPTSSRRAPCGS